MQEHKTQPGMHCKMHWPQLKTESSDLCFASGSAATDAVIKLLNPGDEIIAANDMYGGTYRMFTKVFQKYGLKFHFINMQDANEVSKYINEKHKTHLDRNPH